MALRRLRESKIGEIPNSHGEGLISRSPAGPKHFSDPIAALGCGVITVNS